MQTQETDDATLGTQLTAMTAHQDQQMATMRRQLEQCQNINSATPPPPVIDVRRRPGSGRGRGGNQTRRGPMSDGAQGTTKTEKFYKDCDNSCWSHGYDISPLHDSTNCRFRLPGHIESHTGATPAAGANQKDKQFSKWA